MKSIITYLLETKLFTNRNELIKRGYYSKQADAEHFRNKYHDEYKSKVNKEVEDILDSIKTFDDDAKQMVLDKFVDFLIDNNLILSDNRFATSNPFILYMKEDNRFLFKGGCWSGCKELKYGDYLLNHKVTYKEIKDYYDKKKEK